jgi:hypothetical protein
MTTTSIHPSKSISECLCDLGLDASDEFASWFVSRLSIDGVTNVRALRVRGQDYFDKIMTEDGGGLDFACVHGRPVVASLKLVQKHKNGIFAVEEVPAEVQNFIVVMRAIFRVVTPCLRQIFERKWNALYGTHHTWGTDNAANAQFFEDGKCEDMYTEVGEVDTRAGKSEFNTGIALTTCGRLLTLRVLQVLSISKAIWDSRKEI